MGVISKISTLSKIVFNKDFRFCYFADKGKKGSVPAEEFLKIRYRSEFGKELNLECPETYTEKLQWLKLYDHRPEYTLMVDKFAVKQYVAERIGEEYVIPLLGVWERIEDIDFASLPEKFVLKTTHDSGGLVICKDKKELDIQRAIKKLT
ncbi:MAG: glycosyl transferase, partial [Clostridia bacterium]|nr:glycosyl transferase [Clostridia bacterium]